ncbi:cell division ATP-binding protein FtsE (plasmid) [Rossellomorea sp. AcN35-11]|nr:cell division ATP-binding protein FtsE [Rossellomorea aquimaris]WJV32207.1 cell division ATP-binding protein FtsE [Rossellomorea sp. AcN35-11]
MIELKGVTKKYKNGVEALKGVNLRILPGEFVYIVGPSGSGKSSFIKMLYREELPTEGKITLGNIDVAKIKNRKAPLLRRDIGVVFQDFRLLENLTVFENIAFALEVIEEKPKDIKRLVMEVLWLVGLEGKASYYPSEISGGEQQRVSIARAIVNHPKFVIADEPTGNLDPDTALEIMQILEEINARGTTVIMATHSKEIVNTMKKRVIAFKDGLIVRDEARGVYGNEI